MRTHTQTIASFFSVAMAATLLGALFTTQVRRPRPAEASTAAEVALAQVPRAGGSALTLDTFRDIARASNAGVVNINTSKIVRRPRFRDPFFDFFGFGDDGTQDPGGQDSERARLRSLGSGFVIDADGSILTNRHVIEGADEIRVSFPNGKRYDAKIVGQDARTDVALIKIEPKEALTVLPLGDSDRVEVGEWVMAVGNPFDLGGNSVTVGVVSFKGRDLQLGVRNTSVDMIQTDAAINPGNSGGPLINTRGEVVGINTLIITDGISRANAGVGFSVPINVAKGILPQLRSKGRVDRGWMGVVIGNVSEALAKTYGLSEAKGALVNSVNPGSPAEKAGIKPEEVVLAVDGRPVADSGDLARYISSKAPGTVVKLEVLSVKGERRSVSVTLGTFQDDTQERAERERDTARLGMTLRDLTGPMAERLDLPPSARGVMVMSVETGEAAEEAGIVRGDVIVSVNGTPVADTDAFERAIDEARPNGAARLRVLNRRLGDRVVVLELK